jgi:hypothetical protein
MLGTEVAHPSDARRNTPRPREADMDHPTTSDREVDSALDRLREQRTQLKVRHAQRLTSLMEERRDLRGVHALADYFDDAVRWSA